VWRAHPGQVRRTGCACSGYTPTTPRFVLDARLDLAHRWLREPQATARTVSAIAHDAGFGDVSYFNRTFRTRYGRTPSEVRSGGPA
jgi:AraC-like DNA-binding protein